MLCGARGTIAARAVHLRGSSTLRGADVFDACSLFFNVINREATLPRQSVGRLSVRLADVDVDELVKALHMERSTWIKAPKEQGRRETDAEKVTICVLAALDRPC